MNSSLNAASKCTGLISCRAIQHRFECEARKAGVPAHHADRSAHVKILCTGDLQLGAHGRLADQAEVLGRIAGLAVEHNVDLVLNGGDTFEGPGITPECLEVFAQFVRALRLVGIPVLAISGNGRHDAAMRETNGLDIFRHVDGVDVFSAPGLFRMDGLTVACLPWVSPARLQAAYGAAASRDEVNAHVAELLVDVARTLYDDCRAVGTRCPAVLLTHFAISGASLPTGLPVSMLSEPVLPLAELEAVGFDAVVASHVHRPQLLTSELGGGPVFFTGSPMAHDHGEAGFDHGVWILDLDGGARAEFVPVESRRLLTVDEHLSAHDQLGLELAAAGDVEGAIVRVIVRGTTDEMRSFDMAALRRAVVEAGAHSVKLEPRLERADRARVQGVDESLTELAALELWLSTQAVDGGLAERMRERTRGYLETVA